LPGTGARLSCAGQYDMTGASRVERPLSALLDRRRRAGSGSPAWQRPSSWASAAGSVWPRPAPALWKARTKLPVPACLPRGNRLRINCESARAAQAAGASPPAVRECTAAPSSGPAAMTASASLPPSGSGDTAWPGADGAGSS
jgi:hypothetical protein